MSERQADGAGGAAGVRAHLGAPPAVACTCGDAAAITVEVAEGHRASLHLCPWCGDSWDIDGVPAAREEVHALVPKPRAASWRANPRPQAAGRLVPRRSRRECAGSRPRDEARSALGGSVGRR
jgi:hypothetical protein